MFYFIIYLSCFDPCVLLFVLFSVSVSSSAERGRPNRPQGVQIELPCISMS